MKEFYIKALELGSRKIELRDDQIVCIVGPNNSGKSAFLEKINSQILGKSSSIRPSVLTGLEISKTAVKDEALNLLRRVAKVRDDSFAYRGASFSTGETNASGYFWNKFSNRLGDPVLAPLLDLINARERLDGVKPTVHVDLINGHPAHPLHVLYQKPVLEEKICAISKRIFGVGILLNPGAGSHITLHVGEPVDAAELGGNRTQEYANRIGDLPSILEQGDGMQATIGLVARLISSSCPCILVDEPDLYLHPPQAYELGKTIANEIVGQQTFFATHSVKFLQGLFHSAPDRLKVIRLSRGVNMEFQAFEVDTSVFLEVKADPILKFTNILEALFYENAILCEDPSDCLFFKTVIERMSLIGQEQRCFWVGVFGKGNFQKVARISRALGVNTICIADFDLISSTNNSIEKVLAPLVDALGGNSINSINIIRDAKALAKSVSANGKLSWERFKISGLAEVEFDPSLHGQFVKLLESLNQLGLYVLRSGETESLCVPRVGRHGAEAVSKMLELDILDAMELSKARAEATAIARILH